MKIDKFLWYFDDQHLKHELQLVNTIFLRSIVDQLVTKTTFLKSKQNTETIAYRVAVKV